jgi:putative transposase
MWNLAPPPGFQSFREDLPFTFYQRHLPHWRQDGATYFVTFRLEDSLPQSKLRELESFRREWKLSEMIGEKVDLQDELTRQTIQKIERWLDQGMGSCLLRHADFAGEVVSAMHFFDRTSLPPSAQPSPVATGPQRYELGAYVVMPNHVHAILRPLLPQTYPLEDVLGSWKQFTARQMNGIRPNSGAIWQEESFDRIIRDEEHLWRCIQYIGRNPRLAGLASKVPLWIRPERKALGWDFIADT